MLYVLTEAACQIAVHTFDRLFVCLSMNTAVSVE